MKATGIVRRIDDQRARVQNDRVDRNGPNDVPERVDILKRQNARAVRKLRRVERAGAFARARIENGRRRRGRPRQTRRAVLEVAPRARPRYVDRARKGTALRRLKIFRNNRRRAVRLRRAGGVEFHGDRIRIERTGIEVEVRVVGRRRDFVPRRVADGKRIPRVRLDKPKLIRARVRNIEGLQSVFLADEAIKRRATRYDERLYGVSGDVDIPLRGIVGKIDLRQDRIVAKCKGIA